MITGTAIAFFAAKIVGLGFVGIGFSSLTSAFHQFSFKLEKKGVKTIDTESMREKARQLG
jgi:hypothetical protein